jgi:hypothetical protein
MPGDRPGMTDGCILRPLPHKLAQGLGLAWEPVSGFEPLTCRLQDGCSAD